MNPSGTFTLVTGAALLFGMHVAPVRAATMILHNFTGDVSDGANPYGSLTLSGSKLYGMTVAGGSHNNGTLFSMNTDGSGFGLLHSFAGGIGDGRYPYGSLTLSGSILYGMTKNGGINDSGTLFSMNTDGSGFSLLHSFRGGFSDGDSPYGSLTLFGSKLYGMTQQGGTSNRGTLFSMNTDGTGYSLLHSFLPSPVDGGDPYGSLVLSGSKLYGMTRTGGMGDSGTLFSMNTDGTGFSLLHSFTVGDGYGPYGSLTLSGSTLYGMTSSGGGSQRGTLFRMNIDGTGFGLLRAFTGGADDGASPTGSLTLSGATLYGMTDRGGGSNLGTIFGINTDGSGFHLLESFYGSPADGAGPVRSDLTLSGDASTLYGMTRDGGTSGQGVVFSRSMVPEPRAFALLGFGMLLLAGRRPRAPSLASRQPDCLGQHHR